jgi:hypothetical protein
VEETITSFAGQRMHTPDRTGRRNPKNIIMSVEKQQTLLIYFLSALFIVLILIS